MCEALVKWIMDIGEGRPPGSSQIIPHGGRPAGIKMMLPELGKSSDFFGENGRYSHNEVDDLYIFI